MGTTAIKIGDGFADTQLALFELDESVLAEVMRDDGSVSIKGGTNEEAVLCTAERTYVMRLAESSNTLLLSPDALSEKTLAAAPSAVTMVATASSHYELIASAPRTAALRGRLKAAPYAGAEADAELPDEPAVGGDEMAVEGAPTAGRAARPTMAELERTVQCSAAQLRAALQREGALEVDGGWCVLDEVYEMDVAMDIINVTVEREWPLDAVPVAELVDALPTLDPLAVRHCLRTLSTAAAAPWEAWVAAADPAATPTLALDAAAVYRRHAMYIFNDMNTNTKEQFLELWADNIGSMADGFGVPPELAVLQGLAIEVAGDDGLRGDEPAVLVKALSAADLPATAAPRFAHLFKVKREWTIDELAPYVADLLDPGRTAEQLVLLHARSVIGGDGKRTYVTR